MVVPLILSRAEDDLRYFSDEVPIELLLEVVPSIAKSDGDGVCLIVIAIDNKQRPLSIRAQDRV